MKDVCGHRSPSGEYLCQLRPHPEGEHRSFKGKGKAVVGWPRDGTEPTCEEIGGGFYAYTTTDHRQVIPMASAVREERPVKAPVASGEACSVCGQLAMVRESSCRSRCKACGAIEGGCG